MVTVTDDHADVCGAMVSVSRNDASYSLDCCCRFLSLIYSSVYVADCVVVVENHVCCFYSCDEKNEIVACWVALQMNLSCTKVYECVDFDV